MEKLFEIKHIKKKTYHNDIILKFRDINEIIEIDSYYLIKDKANLKEIRSSLINILLKWKEVIQKEIECKPIYLILDFSDQSFGGFCFELTIEKKLKLTYGFIDNSYDLSMDSVIYELNKHEFVNLFVFDVSLDNFLFTIEENIINLFN